MELRQSTTVPQTSNSSATNGMSAELAASNGDRLAAEADAIVVYVHVDGPAAGGQLPANQA